MNVKGLKAMFITARPVCVDPHPRNTNTAESGRSRLAVTSGSSAASLAQGSLGKSIHPGVMEGFVEMLS